MVNEYTAGPWEISECGGCDIWNILNDNLDSPLIAHCYGTEVEGGIQHEADARLIASVPDMYEALMDIARGPLQGPLPFGDYAIVVAKRIIAKVEEK